MLIADEPTTALDVTTQAQILELLDTLRAEFELTLLLVTHDLGVVAGHADRVVVMYAGRVVEEGPVDEVFDAPRHPYTRGLARVAPERGERRAARSRRSRAPRRTSRGPPTAARSIPGARTPKRGCSEVVPQPRRRRRGTPGSRVIRWREL